MIEFTIDGQPVPQPRHKVSTWGGRARAYIAARHPIHGYKAGIAIVARTRISKPLEGWLAIDIEAIYARPESHRTKAGISKSAPAFPGGVGDWDNLAKAVCDALQGIAYQNDHQVVDGRCRKRYAEPGERPKTVISIREV